MTTFAVPASAAHACDKCRYPKSAANLTRLPNGKRHCPECLYERAQEQLAKPERPAPAPPRAIPGPPAHGLTVTDVPNAMAGRRAALEARRRKTA